MATGFVQRYKGKIAVPVGGIYIGGTQLSGSAADFNTISGSATLQALTSASTTSTITNTGPTTIASSSALTIWRLAKPTSPGQDKVIQLTTVSSGVFITASTDGSVLLNGSSINTTIKSTVAANIDLFATSTSNWAIVGLFISTLATLTISTTT